MPSFVGTWRLLSQVAERTDGTVVYPRGEHPRGLLIYDANGWMSVQLQRQEPRLESPLGELRTALEDYLGYYGTYDINEAQNTVTHHVVGCSYPGWIGSDQVRHYQLDGDRLILRVSFMRSVVGEWRVLTWERITSQ